jgi:hypothetical protein
MFAKDYPNKYNLFFPGTTYKLIQTHTCTVTLLPCNDSFFFFFDCITFQVSIFNFMLELIFWGISSLFCQKIVLLLYMDLSCKYILPQLYWNVHFFSSWSWLMYARGERLCCLQLLDFRRISVIWYERELTAFLFPSVLGRFLIHVPCALILSLNTSFILIYKSFRWRFWIN